MKPVILIPAYKPRSEILTIVREFLRLDISSILVVNDGSGEDFRVLFDHLAEMAGVDVVHHADNQGKGAALRTGFRLIMEKNPDAPGVVTVDADGQHLPGDVAKVTRSLVSNPRTLILGCRRFDGETPLKSAIGNHCTRLIYEIATGARLTDTQTGLRGIPSDVLPLLVKLPSERYAYELDMLLTLHGERYPFLETDIRTVYDGNNESTHFRPAVDSFRVYRVLFSWLFKLRLAKILKYSLSSILSTLVDFGVYAALIYLASATIAGASITARIASVVT
ncbi:MAG: glycosyltransferase family 2 protein, partial [Desulfobacterales bacterium]|nr:glycosyltransferase family 2 protein [Desulfobacterales bacterium]